MANPPPTGTVTFLFTDIEGSTRLAQAHPAEWPALQARHHAILREAIESHGGHVFQIIGDAFCAAFATAADALAAAIDAQRRLTADGGRRTDDARRTTEDDGSQTPSERGSTAEDATRLSSDALPSAVSRLPSAVRRPPSAVVVRMGLHTGAATLRANGDYEGYLAMATVQRVMSIAYGGQTLLSNATAGLLAGQLPDGVTLRDMGEQRLKSLLNPEHLWQVVAPDLPADFPPLQSLNTIPNNLPLQVTSFVGREKEIAEVKRLLNTTRLLTLTGSGGTGKTRLSLQVAAEVLDNYKDGVWLVELAPLADPALVPQTVANVLGIRDAPGRPVLASLVEWLKLKQLLLILDNCEHLIEACANLADAVMHASRDTRIVTSSREALGIAGELAWRVPSLEVPNASDPAPAEALAHYAAIRLFVERASFANAAFRLTDANAPAVAQICARLDGIPLAIELAAARVKLFPPEQIATRLDDRFRLLTGGSRTALPRQQTLRSLIDWSHNLLSEPERVLLRRLSVFAGGWTLEAAQAVCAGGDLDEYTLVELLSHLVDKSLVVAEEQAGSARYHMLETIRQYAREKLLDSEESAPMRVRHLNAFLLFAEATAPKLRGPEQVEWMNRVASEHDNLRAALGWALAQSESAAALRLGGALHWFWWVRGYDDEGLQWLGQALTLSRRAAEPAGMPAEDRGLYARALNAAGLLALSQSDFAAARELLAESLALCQALGDRQGMARLLFIQGSVARNQGDYEQARTLVEKSLSLSREAGDKVSIADALEALGLAARNQGDYGAARKLLEEALARSRELGDKWGIAACLQNLGILAFLSGDSAAAHMLHEECLMLSRELGNTRYMSLALVFLGGEATKQGDYTAARRLLRECLTLGRNSGYRHGISWCLVEFARLAQAEGQPPRVIRLVGAAEALFDHSGIRAEPPMRALFDGVVDAAHAQLDSTTFKAAWEEGRALTLDQAVALALEGSQE